MDRATVESQLERFFADDPHGAAAVYLFGSVARGEARAGSDIDVGVLFAEDPPCTFAGLPFALEADLERLFARRVQVVVLNHAPADLVHRVLRDGRLVLDRDRSRRIRFEVAKRNEYFDLEPLLRRILWPRKPSPRGGAA